jgi:hypothetical protein
LQLSNLDLFLGKNIKYRNPIRPLKGLHNPWNNTPNVLTSSDALSLSRVLLLTFLHVCVSDVWEFICQKIQVKKIKYYFVNFAV